ncbi:MAG: hypothetical protein ACJ761_07400 [Chloroflexota bacterium]
MPDPTVDLYVWSSPRDIEADAAQALIDRWQAAGGDPSESPFEPSTDVWWFHRELTHDERGVEVLSDAVPTTSRTPVWLAPDPGPPARVVRIRLTPDRRDVAESVLGLAAKYDLVVFERGRIHRPLKELAAYASATFWPRGAIRAAVAGGIGLVMAVVAWLVGIPVVSWIIVVIGGFLFVMAVYTFVHEGRVALRTRRARDEG